MGILTIYCNWKGKTKTACNFSSQAVLSKYKIYISILYCETQSKLTNHFKKYRIT